MEGQSDMPSGAGSGQEGDSAPSVTAKLLGDFEIRREVGRGGMGTVYEAWQRSLQRVVALKVLAPHVSSTPRAVLRFQREAQAAAKLHHTHIVPIFAQGEVDGTYFYAMEFVHGQGLNTIIHALREGELSTAATVGLDETVALRRGDSGVHRTPPADALSSDTAVGMRRKDVASGSKARGIQLDFRAIAEHMANVADALTYAHGQGVIHRDIKPHNLILGNDGRMRVSDFGLARLSEQPGVTITGELLGSPLYMSPEQIRGNPDEVDARADIYSLGATLYEWLTLQPPYPGETRERVISLILSSEPKPVRSLNPAVPIDLETICMKAIERDRERRYRTAAELRDDLRRFIASRPIEARRTGLMRTAAKFIGRHQVGALLTLAGLVAILLGVQVYSKQRKFETATAKVVEATQQAEQTAVQNELFAEILEMVGGTLQTGPANVVDVAVPLFQNLAQADPSKLLSSVKTEASDPRTDSLGQPLGMARRSAIEFFQRMMPPDWPGPAKEGENPAMDHVRTALRQWSDSKVEEALTSASEYLSTDPTSFEVLQLHAILSVQLGNYEAIAEDASKLIASGKQAAVAYTWKGLASLLQQQPAMSLNDFSAAIEADRKLPWPWVLRGLALLELGRPSEALAEFDTALSIAPKLAVAMVGRAKARSDLGYHEASVQDATEVLKAEPDRTDALVIRAESEKQLGQLAPAARDLERAIQLAGKTPTLLAEYWRVAISLRAQERSRVEKKPSESEMAPTTDPDEHRSRGPFLDNFFRKMPSGGSAPRTPGASFRFPGLP